MFKRMQIFFNSILMFTSIYLYCCTVPEGKINNASSKKILRLVANGVLADATFQFIDQNDAKIYSAPADAPSNSQIQLQSAYNDWRYWNGILNLAMLEISDILNEVAYKKFVAKNVGFGFDHYSYFESKWDGENKWEYPFGQFFILEELDDGGAMGASVIEVYQSDPQERYWEYIDQVADHILIKQDRLTDSTLVRSFPRCWTVWADDLYMGISFLARMGELTGDIRYFDDAAKQVINYHKYLFSDEKGLMTHCWYSDLQQPGIAFWGRANGWALLAQVDLLDHLPQNYPKRDMLLALFKKHIQGIVRYQSDIGLWHQLLNKDDSYLETSCSAIFTYVLARAVNKGYIESYNRSYAQLGWQGILTKIRSDGQIEGVCTGTGVSDNLEFYYNRPTPLNDVHGIGFILLAGAEMLEIDHGK